MDRTRVALTIAGSDPSGGAGIQSDLKTFSRLRVYGMAVIAALTAQNTEGVSGVASVEPEFVSMQLDAVLSDIPPDATKTGMLSTPEIVEAVAGKIHQYRVRNLVVDPVIVSTSGTPLLDSKAIDVFRRILLPQAFIITPNLDEARALTGKPIDTVEDMEEAALRIHGLGAANVFIKGGHGKGDEITDVFFDGSNFTHLRAPRIGSRSTHGTGCVLSAAITAYLGLGKPAGEAIQLGKDFVTEAIRNGLTLGKGIGPCDPLSLGG
ncbi:MAG TPA: bifunctional hydroxymethylpyrimidine kinase/phosphomethylpyrimidine kinase [Terriglobia bacterium]|nr:bifunctional hydroxymethylpyrimidine kinase/phosphomethylpyrimidine kinase [Terriglobia bacterium]